MIILTATYPYSSDGRFDFDHYVNVHVPLTLSVWSEFITGVSVNRGVPGLDGSDPAYSLMAQVYFKSADALARAMQCARMGELVDDVAHYSEQHAQVTIGESLIT